MGFFAVAYAFGFGLCFSKLAFSHISAYLNPAVLLALLVLGELSAVDFILLSTCQIAAGFCASILMFTVYLPHFRTVPEPASKDILLRTIDDVDRNSLRIASYNTKSSASKPKGFKAQLSELKYYLTSLPPEDEIKHILSETGAKYFDDSVIPEPPSRHLAQIGLLQRHLHKQENPHLHVEHPTSDVAKSLLKANQIHAAALKADQAVKLQTFVNRPAIYLPVHNFAVECICSCTFVTVALLLQDRFKSSSDLVKEIYSSGVGQLLIGLFLQLAILSLGGATGFTINPARDIGPRFAHFILPIHNKGGSEWNYSFIINLAIMSGGAIAGGLVAVIRKSI